MRCFRTRYVWLLLLACALPAVAADAVSEQDMAALEETRGTFREYCTMCHGADGVPMLPDVPNFATGERMEKSDAELLAVMKTGSGVMPPWEDVIDDDVQQNLVTYARGIAGDVIFQRQCADCHSASVPPLSGSIPTGAALSEFAGSLAICSGDDVEAHLSRGEIRKVIAFLEATTGLATEN